MARYFRSIAAAVLLLAAAAPIAAQTATLGGIEVSIRVNDLMCVTANEHMWTALIMEGLPFSIMGRSAEMQAVAEERARYALEQCRAGELNASAVPLQIWTTHYGVTPESVGTTAEEVKGFMHSFFCNVAAEELQRCRAEKFESYALQELPDTSGDDDSCSSGGDAETLYRLTSGPITYADIGTSEAEVLELVRQQHLAEAREAISRCRNGDTTAAETIEYELEGYGFSPSDVGATKAEVHGFIHADHIRRARGLLETCRTDSDGVTMVKWLENYVANTEVKPWEIGTTEAELDSMREEAKRLKQREQQKLEEPKQKL